MDFDSSPTYESLGIEYGVIPGTTGDAWRLCSRTGNVPTPSPTATPTPTPTPSPSPSPSPSPTPTPTPSPTPVPTPTPQPPIIIVPGFMASWNKDAILHNKSVSYSDWTLLGFIKEYDGLINTLKNLGFKENTDFFIFPYDWRQPIENDTSDLNNFLQEKIWNSRPDQKVDIVGHSLGGLIARIYTQKNKDKVDKVISVASPHLGVPQVYKPLEAGEIDRENTFLWLAEKTILILNKSAVESDKVTIANKFPILKDIFPTFNFLKNSNGDEIPTANLNIKNDFLPSYNQSVSDIFSIFTSIYGDGAGDTPSGFIVSPADVFNLLAGNYSDGQPQSSLSGVGDTTVLSNSANMDSDSIKFNFDHREIITKKDVVKKILEILNINVGDDQIVEGQRTVISPSLVFMIRSPATMKVKFGDNTYSEEDGIVFIPNAQSGSYKLDVQGTDQGLYKIQVGQISENNDVWERIDGEITQVPASSQIDNYSVNYDSQTAVSIFATPTPTPTTTPAPTSSSTSTSTSTSTTSLTPAPTPTPQPTNFSEAVLTKLLEPSVLGTSTSKIASESPKEQTMTEPEPKLSRNLILLLIIPGAGIIFWIFRRKFWHEFLNFWKWYKNKH